jgi:SWI/SNF-related matrix-associated actin-dependent regulator of chromatin subfamily A member 5
VQEREDALLSQPASAVHVEKDNVDYDAESDVEVVEEVEPKGGRKRGRPAADPAPAKAAKPSASAGPRKGLSDKERRGKEVERQLTELRGELARAQKSRLRFLLGQSDIFQHFLDEGGKAKDAKDVEALLASPKKKDGKKGGAGAGAGGKRKATRGKGEEEEEGAGGEVAMKPATRLLKQPASVTGGTMRDYQLEGLNWMISLHENGLNGILADEMGLGKTLQSISLLAWALEGLGNTGPHMVLVPKSTLGNWEREFARFTPNMKTLMLQGDKDTRAELIRTRVLPGQTYEERKWHVLLTTYEVACIEEGPLSKIPWKYIVIDEAHRIKNENSNLASVVRGFTSAHRLLITGTPLQNNLHELWALLNFLLPDVFGSSGAFDEWFNLAADGQDENAKAEVVRQLHRVLRPFMLRRLKSEVAKTLPPKTETMLYCGFSKVQKDLYRGLLMRNIAPSMTGAGGGDKMRLANLVMHLRKACCHPYLFEGVEDRSADPMGEHLVQNCAKLKLMDKLLARLKERGSRCLIFTQFKTVLDILEDYAVMRGHQYCRIDGSTSYDEREEGIDSFNAPGSDKFIFLLSTRAGGLGINLATADTVILYDSDWNPQMDLQAMDRAHRIGQTKPVRVYRLITSGSIEEKVIERAWVKLKLDAVVVQTGRLADRPKGLSKEDMMEMVQFGATAVFGKGGGGALGTAEGVEEDAAIDAILAEGEERTKALADSVAATISGGGAKGMFDFSLDGSVTTQVFEGVDYRHADARRKMLEDAALALKLQVADAMAQEAADERAARRTAAGPLSYNEDRIFKTLQESGGANASAKAKQEQRRLRALLPLAHQPPPRMSDPWALFDHKRIDEICAQEIAWLQARGVKSGKRQAGAGAGAGAGEGGEEEEGDGAAPIVIEDWEGEEGGVGAGAGEEEAAGAGAGAGEGGEGSAPPAPAGEEGAPAQAGVIDPRLPFPAALIAERDELLRVGYPGWRRTDFDAYTAALKQFGRDDAASIAASPALSAKGPGEVLRYHHDFWELGRGRECLPEALYSTLLKAVEKGEATQRELGAQDRALTVRMARMIGGNASERLPLQTAPGTPAALAKDPWRSLPLPSALVGAPGRTVEKAVVALSRSWTADADRYILCSLGRAVEGGFDGVKAGIMAEPRFRADRWLRARSEAEVEARARILLKANERELPETMRREERLAAERDAARVDAARRSNALGDVTRRAGIECYTEFLDGVARDAEAAIGNAMREAERAAKRKADAAAAASAPASAAAPTAGAGIKVAAPARAPSAPKVFKSKATEVPPALLPALLRFLPTSRAVNSLDLAGAFVASIEGEGFKTAKAQVAYLVDLLADRSKEMFRPPPAPNAPPDAPKPGLTFRYSWTVKPEVAAEGWAGMTPANAVSAYASRPGGPYMVQVPVAAPKAKPEAGAGAAKMAPAKGSPVKPSSGSKAAPSLSKSAASYLGLSGPISGPGAGKPAPKASPSPSEDDVILVDTEEEEEVKGKGGKLPAGRPAPSPAKRAKVAVGTLANLARGSAGSS